MKQKFIILLIGSLFLISSNGFPLISHYCSMMQQKMDECGSCETVEIKTSCCKSEDLPNVKISQSECCIDEFTFNKIEDFFAGSFYKTSSQQLLICILGDVALSSNSFLYDENSFNSNSPPAKTGREFLTSVHQLKIALPLS